MYTNWRFWMLDTIVVCLSNIVDGRDNDYLVYWILARRVGKVLRKFQRKQLRHIIYRGSPHWVRFIYEHVMTPNRNIKFVAEKHLSVNNDIIFCFLPTHSLKFKSVFVALINICSDIVTRVHLKRYFVGIELKKSLSIFTPTSLAQHHNNNSALSEQLSNSLAWLNYCFIYLQSFSSSAVIILVQQELFNAKLQILLCIALQWDS